MLFTFAVILFVLWLLGVVGCTHRGIRPCALGHRACVVCAWLDERPAHRHMTGPVTPQNPSRSQQ